MAQESDDKARPSSFLSDEGQTFQTKGPRMRNDEGAAGPVFFGQRKEKVGPQVSDMSTSEEKEITENAEKRQGKRVHYHICDKTMTRRSFTWRRKKDGKEGGGELGQSRRVGLR